MVLIVCNKRMIKSLGPISSILKFVFYVKIWVFRGCFLEPLFYKYQYYIETPNFIIDEYFFFFEFRTKFRYFLNGFNNEYVIKENSPECWVKKTKQNQHQLKKRKFYCDTKKWVLFFFNIHHLLVTTVSIGYFLYTFLFNI